MMLLQRAIEVSESKEMSVQEYLSKVIKVVSKEISVQEYLSKVIKVVNIGT